MKTSSRAEILPLTKSYSLKKRNDNKRIQTSTITKQLTKCQLNINNNTNKADRKIDKQNYYYGMIILLGIVNITFRGKSRFKDTFFSRHKICSI